MLLFIALSLFQSTPDTDNLPVAVVDQFGTIHSHDRHRFNYSELEATAAFLMAQNQLELLESKQWDYVGRDYIYWELKVDLTRRRDAWLALRQAKPARMHSYVLERMIELRCFIGVDMYENGEMPDPVILYLAR